MKIIIRNIVIGVLSFVSRFVETKCPRLFLCHVSLIMREGRRTLEFTNIIFPITFSVFNVTLLYFQNRIILRIAD